MKSAFELAMERLGGFSRELSQEQKEKLAEIDQIYEARIAQLRFDMQNRLSACLDDISKREQIQADSLLEIRSLEAQRERKKEELRKSFDKS